MSNISSEILLYYILKGVFISHISVELPIFKMRNSTSNGCFCWHQFLTNDGKFHQKLVEITTIANGIKVGFSHPLGLTVAMGSKTGM